MNHNSIQHEKMWQPQWKIDKLSKRDNVNKHEQQSEWRIYQFNTTSAG